MMEKVEELYNKICRYTRCQKTFLARRLNQAFCTQACKTKHNNSIARELRESTKAIDHALKKNLHILHEFYTSGKREIVIEELEREGFKHATHTGTRKSTDGKSMFPVYYHYGLIHVLSNTFKIEKL